MGISVSFHSQPRNTISFAWDASPMKFRQPIGLPAISSHRFVFRHKITGSRRTWTKNNPVSRSGKCSAKPGSASALTVVPRDSLKKHPAHWPTRSTRSTGVDQKGKKPWPAKRWCRWRLGACSLSTLGVPVQRVKRLRQAAPPEPGRFLLPDNRNSVISRRRSQCRLACRSDRDHKG